MGVALNSREIVQDWLTAEHSYVDGKWGVDRPVDDLGMEDDGASLEGHWGKAVTMYIHRASLLGLDNPLGRQALMKGLATMFAMCESMVRVYGEPPQAGVPSGRLGPEGGTDV